MATPAEIVARWDARLALEEAEKKAVSSIANDNAVPEPDGYLIFGDERMPYWLTEKDRQSQGVVPLAETA